MALSWADIFPDVDGEPVRASLDEVEGVATMFERMGDASQRVLDEFERVTSESGSGSLEGEAADAFRDIVDKVADSLGDLPGVCEDAHDALADHASRLADLRAEAASALARARTRWEAVEDAKRTVSSRSSSHDQAAADVDNLPPAGSDPTADADRTAAEAAAEQSGRLLAAAQGALDAAEDDLRASRAEWGDLRGDEDQLNDRTAERLDDISLGDLEDPGWWESILGSAFDLVMDLTGLDALIDLVAAIASGDWAAALWALRELLDRVLMIVAVVALFTPLGPLVLALVAIKLAASIALYATKWPSPETGQTIGLVDVAMDGADVLGAAGDVLVAGRAVAAINAATPPSGAATPPTPPTVTGRTNGWAPDPNTTINLSTTGRTPDEAGAITDYARRSNDWLARNGPQTIQSTDGQLRAEATAAARAERLRAARAGTPYQGQAGHVPDTAITGQANPPAGWLDMPGYSNQVAGGPLGSRVGQDLSGFTVDGNVV